MVRFEWYKDSRGLAFRVIGSAYANNRPAMFNNRLHSVRYTGLSDSYSLSSGCFRVISAFNFFVQINYLNRLEKERTNADR